MTNLNELRNDTATAMALFTHDQANEELMTQNVDAAADVLDLIAEYTIAKATQQYDDSLHLKESIQLDPSKTPPEPPRPRAA